MTLIDPTSAISSIETPNNIANISNINILTYTTERNLLPRKYLMSA